MKYWKFVLERDEFIREDGAVIPKELWEDRMGEKQLNDENLDKLWMISKK